MSSYVKYKVPIKNFKILDIDDSVITDKKISYSKEAEIKGEKIVLNISLQEIEMDNNIFAVKVICDKDLSEKDLMPLAIKYVNNLLNKIAFYSQNAEVGEPWIVDEHTKDKKIGTTEIYGSVFVSTENRDKKLLENLCKEIKQGSNFDNEDYNLFRAAMNNEDIVVKYMFLYQILSFQHLNSKGVESQKMVDEYIKSKCTKEEYKPQNSGYKGKEETIYTRLRNQVGHYRWKTSQQTRRDMSAKMQDLIKLVKKSITDNN